MEREGGGEGRDSSQHIPIALSHSLFPIFLSLCLSLFLPFSATTRDRVMRHWNNGEGARGEEILMFAQGEYIPELGKRPIGLLAKAPFRAATLVGLESLSLRTLFPDAVSFLGFLSRESKEEGFVLLPRSYSN